MLLVVYTKILFMIVVRICNQQCYYFSLCVYSGKDSNQDRKTKNKARTIQSSFTLVEKVDFLGHLIKNNLKQGLSSKIKQIRKD